jgi:hypothetical protein
MAAAGTKIMTRAKMVIWRFMGTPRELMRVVWLRIEARSFGRWQGTVRGPMFRLVRRGQRAKK